MARGNVSTGYNDIIVVDELLCIKRGELHAVVGRKAGDTVSSFSLFRNALQGRWLWWVSKPLL